jgi:hypothetical protein
MASHVGALPVVIPAWGIAFAVAACVGSWGIDPARLGVAEFTTAAQPTTISVTHLLSVMIDCLESMIGPHATAGLFHTAQFQGHRRGRTAQCTLNPTMTEMSAFEAT